jgi:hypothetical protein
VDDTPDNQRFTGFGLPENGLSEQEIHLLLIAEYNRAQIGKKIVPENDQEKFKKHEINAQRFETHIINPDTFYRSGGGKFMSMDERFNHERVNLIAQLSVEDAVKQVREWI